MGNKNINIIFALFIVFGSISIAGAVSNTTSTNLKDSHVPPDIMKNIVKNSSGDYEEYLTTISGIFANYQTYDNESNIGNDMAYIDAYIDVGPPNRHKAHFGWAFVDPTLKNRGDMFSMLQNAYWHRESIYVVIEFRGMRRVPFIVGVIEPSPYEYPQTLSKTGS